MKILIIALTILTLSSFPFTPAQAETNSIRVDINGLVCDFCARALEKVFGKQESVRSIDVKLNEKLLTIHLKGEDTLDDATITKLVNDAGYDVRKIHRE